MNQTLKDCIYGLGSNKQVDFMADLGGMNTEEKEVFRMIHEKKPDQTIMDLVGLSRKSYSRVEESVRSKLMIAVFDCINSKMREQ